MLGAPFDLLLLLPTSFALLLRQKCSLAYLVLFATLKRIVTRFWSDLQHTIEGHRRKLEGFRSD